MDLCHVKFRWVYLCLTIYSTTSTKYHIITINGVEWRASRLKAAEIGLVKRAERSLPIIQICLLREALYTLNFLANPCLRARVRHMTDLSLKISLEKSSKTPIFLHIAGFFKEVLKIFLRNSWTFSMIDLTDLLIGLNCGRVSGARLTSNLLNLPGRTDLVSPIWILCNVSLKINFILLHHQICFIC